MSYFDHSFEGLIVHHDVGTYRYTVVFCPPEIAALLPFDRHPRLRISGEVGEVPFSAAWQPVRGRWYVMLSKGLMREGGFAVGDIVDVRFRVEDQDSVEMPDGLRRALDRDAVARAAWEALSAGRRRGIAHIVASAKTAETQQRRIGEVIAVLRGEREEGRYAGPPKRIKRSSSKAPARTGSGRRPSR